MQNRFNNDDFEHFVKQSADQYRMFPSDKVWKGIHNTLHTRRRWYGFGLAFLLLTTGVVTWVMLTPSGKNRQVADTLPKNISIQAPAIEKQVPATIALVSPKPVNTKTSFPVPAEKLGGTLFAASNSITTETGTTEITEANDIALLDLPSPVTKVEEINQPESLTRSNQVPNKQGTQTKPVVTRSILPVAAIPVYTFESAPIAKVSEVIETTPLSEERTQVKNDIYPYTIESVLNSYTRISKKKRISLQAYVTPTISYRELKENKPYINYSRNTANGITAAYYTVDINSVVTHKPDVGLQFGFSAGYPLSKTLKVIGGLQFNISKYDIKAYDGPSEVATISLSNATSGSNTVSTLSNYRSTGSSAGANWLHNLYFSASVPVGLELRLMNSRKAYVGVSGTIQPTYIISNRAYLISTDYKNYAEVPSLTRKWNMNTGFEVFAGYTTGKVNWRVGPQVRYQAMSSFENKYPIKEHLFDFGLKLGVMLNK